MSKRFFTAVLFLLFSAGIATAQGEQPAHLRIMQLSYLPPSDSVIDIQLNGMALFEGITYPFTTDAVEIAPGDYTLTTSIANQPDASASTPLRLETGRHYSVVVNGDYSKEVTYIVIDEGEPPADLTGSAATIVNLTGVTIEDLRRDDELVAEAIPVGGYATMRLPNETFEVRARLGGYDYAQTFTPEANTNHLIAVQVQPSGDPSLINHRSSPLTIEAYLNLLYEGAELTGAAALIAQTDVIASLPETGVTLFLPTNSALNNFASAVMAIDAEPLGGLIATHIVAQNLPPYELLRHEQLTTLAGNSAALDFGTTESGLWEIEGVPILWDIRLADGVIYGINGVMLSE